MHIAKHAQFGHSMVQQWPLRQKPIRIFQSALVTGGHAVYDLGSTASATTVNLFRFGAFYDRLTAWRANDCIAAVMLGSSQLSMFAWAVKLSTCNCKPLQACKGVICIGLRNHSGSGETKGPAIVLQLSKQQPKQLFQISFIFLLNTSDSCNSSRWLILLESMDFWHHITFHSMHGFIRWCRNYLLSIASWW